MRTSRTKKRIKCTAQETLFNLIKFENDLCLIQTAYNFIHCFITFSRQQKYIRNLYEYFILKLKSTEGLMQ